MRHRLLQSRQYWFDTNCPYKMVYFTEFDYTILAKIPYRAKSGRGDNATYNDAVIMADTETSKKPNSLHNHVVAWTISIRAVDRNIVTLYGTRPTEFVSTVKRLMENMQGAETYIYFHNLAYDYVFLRRYLMNEFGEPTAQLSTKPHYPINIVYSNGLHLKDSLILAQRSLNKWAIDLDVEHKKAVGKWEYDKLRNQGETFTSDELEYIECDTLAGVECIDAMRHTLNKHLFAMPMTATGIPREEVKQRGKENGARDQFKRRVMTYEQYEKSELVYHGGYTHANRHIIGDILTDIIAFDFASSYPFVMLSEKYPCEKFTNIGNKPYQYIVESAEDYAFMFKFIATNIRLKTDNIAMPMLQKSKSLSTVNAITDNGRILCANYVEIYLTEQDLLILLEQYDFDNHICADVEVARKDYLPRWFTDYVFELFRDKTLLKTGNPINYAIAKAKLNSLYGLCVQKNIRDTYVENYTTGEYTLDESTDRESAYHKFLSKKDNVLLYQTGVWVTAYAMRNLFRLGSCCELWAYSDTDSCYGQNWDMDKVNAYNELCKSKLRANGYGCVEFNNREYWLGLAELDGEYSEYVALHSKCYCARSKETGKLKITVAGVPKIGAECLKNDIHNFKPGMIFDGKTTGKLTHTYFFVDGEYIDEYGNETADSINLTECDYLMSNNEVEDWERYFNREIEVQIYG